MPVYEFIMASASSGPTDVESGSGPDALDRAVALVMDAASPVYRVEAGEPSSVVATYLDGFDWRALASGAWVLLEHDPGRRVCTLRRIDVTTGADSMRASARSPGKSTEGWLRFDPAGVQDADLRAWLSGVLGDRALVAQATLSIRRRPLSLRDAEGKTVIRVTASLPAVVSVHPFAPPLSSPVDLPVRISVEALRGYEEAAGALVEQLGAGPDWRACNTVLLEEALAVGGRRTGDYESAFNLKLAGSLPARDALRAVLLHLLDMLEANEPGTVADWDAEFLHDYRVAIRRTRTALGQLKPYLPDFDRFRAGFGALGQATGPVRDLDVSLADFGTLQASVPTEMRAGLEPLTARWVRARRTARKALVAHLSSEAHRRFLAAWREALIGPSLAREIGIEWPTESARPIGDIAGERILKTFKRVIKEGRAIDADSPPEAMHDLRKTCKKLRYLLEFFQDLYAPRSVKALIKALKSLQDNLGAFQDCEVQAHSMMAIGQSFAVQDKQAAASLMSIGAAVAGLLARQHAAREAFADVFDRFASKENQMLVRQLVKP